LLHRLYCANADLLAVLHAHTAHKDTGRYNDGLAYLSLVSICLAAYRLLLVPLSIGSVDLVRNHNKRLTEARWRVATCLLLQAVGS
jgi:hypothetical protein